ncbi:hypothetical protein N9F08_00445 [bacterium]|nr:hypothetical protein [bacterium]
MGYGPSLRDEIKAKAAAEEALEVAIKKVRATMNNEEAQALAYINNHTNGVIISDDTRKPEITFTNNESYSKFKQEYSLKALALVIDGVIEVAKNGMKAAATEGDDPKAVIGLIGSIGGLIKSGLALASSSSTATTKLAVTFSQFSIGDKNFAVYNAINSGEVKAENAWGNKEITLVAQTTVIARVEPDPNLTYADMLQDDLNAVEGFNKALIQEEMDAIKNHTKNTAELSMISGFIESTEADIKKYRDLLYGV